MILCGTDSTSYWQHFLEILVHIEMVASHCCCRFVGYITMMKISCFTTSQTSSTQSTTHSCSYQAGWFHAVIRIIFFPMLFMPNSDPRPNVSGQIMTHQNQTTFFQFPIVHFDEVIVNCSFLFLVCGRGTQCGLMLL